MESSLPPCADERSIVLHLVHERPAHQYVADAQGSGIFAYGRDIDIHTVVEERALSLSGILLADSEAPLFEDPLNLGGSPLPFILGQLVHGSIGSAHPLEQGGRLVRAGQSPLMSPSARAASAYSE